LHAESWSPLLKRSVLIVAFLIAGCHRPLVDEDELCALQLDRAIHNVTDIWTVRWAVWVTCSSGERQLGVTVTPANGSPELSAKVIQEVKERVEGIVRPIWETKGWQTRYSVVKVQVVP
jgi:hypothetical protein